MAILKSTIINGRLTVTGGIKGTLDGNATSATKASLADRATIANNSELLGGHNSSHYLDYNNLNNKLIENKTISSQSYAKINKPLYQEYGNIHEAHHINRKILPSESGYYKIGKLTLNHGDDGYATCHIQGRIGGYEASNVSYVDIIIGNRSSRDIKGIYISGADTVDIIVTNSADSEYALIYLKSIESSWSVIDIDVSIHGKSCEFLWDNTVLSSIEGTQECSLFDSENIFKIKQGKGYNNGSNILVDQTTTSLDNYIKFEKDSRVRTTDANTFLENGFIKTFGSSTTNLPDECTESDKWGVLFCLLENPINKTGSQMYFPIDGKYLGKVYVRSLVYSNPQTTENTDSKGWSRIAYINDIENHVLTVDGDVTGSGPITSNIELTIGNEKVTDAKIKTISPSKITSGTIGTEQKKVNLIGDVTGNATSANKLNTNAGTENISEKTIKPIYFKDGIPKEFTSTIGSSIKPVYLNNGKLTECSEFATKADFNNLNKYFGTDNNNKVDKLNELLDIFNTWTEGNNVLDTVAGYYVNNSDGTFTLNAVNKEKTLASGDVIAKTAKTLTETLSINKGGTGGTTANDAMRNLINGMNQLENPSDIEIFPAASAKGQGSYTFKKLWENYIKGKVEKGLVMSGDIIRETKTNDIIIPDSTSFYGNPVSKYFWHNLLAFDTYGTAEVEVKQDGVWYERNDNHTLRRSPFIEKENMATTVITPEIVNDKGQVTKEQRDGTRWTWTTSMHCCAFEWLVMAFTWNGIEAKKHIKLECWTDKEGTKGYHNLCDIVYDGNSKPIWIKIPDYSSGLNRLVLTIERDGSDDKPSVASLTTVKLLTARWGNQGLGSEIEKPYNWDYHANLLPKHSGESGLGTSDNRWTSIYANSLNVTGSLTKGNDPVLISRDVFGIPLSRNQKLNELRTPGSYFTSSTEIVTSLVNTPEGMPKGELYLEVRFAEKKDYTIQELTAKNSTSIKKYIRFSHGTDNNTSWKPWNEISFAGHNHNGVYLPINGKAADSEKLDNHDSSYFATSTHNHDDKYLGKTAKAADSEKLDGLDSTAFVKLDTAQRINGLKTFGRGITSPCLVVNSKKYWMGLGGDTDGNFKIGPTTDDGSHWGTDKNEKLMLEGHVHTESVTIKEKASFEYNSSDGSLELIFS